MPAVLIASFLGFEPPDMQVLYLFFASIAGLFFVLLVIRGIGRLKEKKIERKSAWQTFHKIARARGLKRKQIEVLSFIAENGDLKRPAQIMGSISLFDRVVDQVQIEVELSERQLILLDDIRKKLVSTAELQDDKKERRQLERVDCAIKIGLKIVPRDEIEQEIRSRELDDENMLKTKIAELAGSIEADTGQITSLSAGGIAVMVGDSVELQPRDFVGLIGSGECPIDFNDIWGEIRSLEPQEEKAVIILHLRFLNYDQEKKRAIIHLVYQTQEERQKKAVEQRKKQAQRSPAATSRKKSTKKKSENT